MFQSKKKSNTLVWIDMEFSGLNPDKEVILEIATVVSDNQLNIIAKGPNISVNQPLSVFENMDEWNKEHHYSSGLVEKCLKSPYNVEKAEQITLDFLKQYCNGSQTSPLCGNSIHQDRRFLYKYMPKVSDYLHYRNIDVSSLKELCVRWDLGVKHFKKENKHRALDDILESIEELKFYRKNLFNIR